MDIPVGKDLLHDPEARLLEVALQTRLRAYAPYSRFLVGAAALTRGGTIFVGCNIENGAYGATMCAERVALFSAVAAGKRDISHVAVVADCAMPITPCGSCRQVLAELAPTAQILMANVNGDVKRAFTRDLLPDAFACPHNEALREQS
jgi:cytidine deaminase